MICTTLRKDDECVFMTLRGCTYNEGKCMQIVEQCDGCKKVAKYDTGTFCKAVPDPSLKWKAGNCNLATHTKVADSSKKKKINPIKASKRR